MAGGFRQACSLRVRAVMRATRAHRRATRRGGGGVRPVFDRRVVK